MDEVEKTEEQAEAPVEGMIEEQAIDPEVAEAMSNFDKKIDDDDDSGVEDSEEPDDDDATGEKPAEKKADDKDSGKEKSADVEKTADDKEIADAIKAVEEAAIADAGKTDDQKQAEKVAEEQKVKAAEVAKTSQNDVYESDLDPEEWDSEVIELDRKRGQQALDAQKALQAKNDELLNIIHNEQNSRHAEWLDRKIQALGENFHDVLGEGEFDDLEPASEQMENRIKLGNRMATIAQAYVSLGRPVPSRSKLFERAVGDVFKEIINKPQKDAETAEKLKERSKLVLGRNKGKAAAQTALEKSSQALKDFDKKIDD